MSHVGAIPCGCPVTCCITQGGGNPRTLTNFVPSKSVGITRRGNPLRLSCHVLYYIGRGKPCTIQCWVPSHIGTCFTYGQSLAIALSHGLLRGIPLIKKTVSTSRLTKSYLNMLMNLLFPTVREVFRPFVYFICVRWCHKCMLQPVLIITVRNV